MKIVTAAVNKNKVGEKLRLEEESKLNNTQNKKNKVTNEVKKKRR